MVFDSIFKNVFRRKRILTDVTVSQCSHSRSKCVETFSFILKMKFYLQNVYCIEIIKEIKRERFDSELKIMSTRKKRFRQIKNHDQDVKLNT